MTCVMEGINNMVALQPLMTSAHLSIKSLIKVIVAILPQESTY